MPQNNDLLVSTAQDGSKMGSTAYELIFLVGFHTIWYFSNKFFDFFVQDGFLLKFFDFFGVFMGFS
jgi:hypothetical protein